MLSHFDRWIGVRTPLSHAGFATLFAERRLSPVGGDFFGRWAARHGVTLRAGNDEGLVPDFERLAWDRFDPRRVDPVVREFYERTSRFSVTITSVDWNGAWHIAGRAFRWAWADRAGNLRPPLDVGAGRREVQSTVSLLDVGRDGLPPYRIWRRAFETDGELLYVASVHTFLAAHTGGDQAYLTLTFPWPFFALTVVLACANGPNHGDLEMSTRAAGAPLAGTYAVVPGQRGRASFVRLPGLHEHFRFGASSGRGAAVIEGTHSAYVGAARVFTLKYEIARDSRTASAAGAASTPASGTTGPIGGLPSAAPGP